MLLAPLARAGERAGELTPPLLGVVLIAFCVSAFLMDAVGSPSLLLVAPVMGGACYLAARLGGEDDRTAPGIGALMDSPKLMEPIIVSIGLQKGIIGPPLFAMLVPMAIVTTTMAVLAGS